MYVKFWGTRGSTPTPISSKIIKQKIRRALEGAIGLDLSDTAALNQYMDRLPFTTANTIGGNTPCLEICSGDQTLIVDAGTGLRELGLTMFRQGFAAGNRQADLLITHTHWDHIQGFPFFRPAFVAGNRFTFHSPFADLAVRLEQQQQARYFPVPVNFMRATLNFNRIAPDEWHQIGRFRVYPMRLSHPGVTYGYRIEDDHACVVVATDSEYKRVDRASTEQYVQFFHRADLLVFDAQYSLSEALDKLDWGHSTAIMGAELAHRANVKRLALFHHDPTSSDDEVWESKEQAEAYLDHRNPAPQSCEVLVAHDGLTLNL